MLLKNLSKLLDDPRRRNVILITFLVLLTMIFVGGIRLFRQIGGKHLPRGTRIESMQPSHLHGAKGGKITSQAYAKLQMEHNRKKEQEAKKRGRSSIASIVDGFNMEDKQPEGQNTSQRGNYAQLPVFPSEAEQAMNQHQAFMAQQKTELTRQQMQGAIHQQMNQLFTTWNQSPTQATEETTLDSTQYAEAQKGSGAHLGPVLVKAGTILQAVLLTEVNSDEPSPVLAKITTGDFKDGRLIGTLSRTGERLLIQFHTLDLPNNSRTVPIHALGVDANTARTSLASHVDRHTLLRYGSFFAASFLQGVGMSTRFQAGDTLLQAPTYKGMVKGTLVAAAGNVGTQFGSELAQQLHIPPTVCVHAGVSMGILFTADLADSSDTKI